MPPSPHLARTALLLASLGLLACSDSSPPIDAGATEAGARDAWRGEGAAPDLYTGPCDPSCLEEDLSLCVRLAGEQRCVECLHDSHCQANPGALGGKCDMSRNYCICESDQECAGNQRGAHCQQSHQMCVCQGDHECQEPLPLCLGIDLSTCRPACKADLDCGSFPYCDLATGRCLACKTEADCQQNIFNPHCQTATGRCLACTADSHCPAAAPRCAEGSCVECSQPSDCAASPRGSLCAQGSCSCQGSADCQATASLGSSCLLELAFVRCGCKADTDCGGKAVGRACQLAYQRCGCSVDTDCLPPLRCTGTRFGTRICQ